MTVTNTGDAAGKDGFANYGEATAAPTDYTMSEERKANNLNASNYDLSLYDNGEAEMPVTGAKNGGKLADLRGKDFDDPLWDDLLDELSALFAQRPHHLLRLR